MKTKLLFLYFFLATFSFSQDKLAYQIYTKEGKKTNYAKMIKAMQGKKAVFLVNCMTIQLRIGWN